MRHLPKRLTGLQWNNNDDREMFQNKVVNIFSYDCIENEFKTNLIYIFSEYFFKSVVGSETWKNGINKKSYHK